MSEIDLFEYMKLRCCLRRHISDLKYNRRWSIIVREIALKNEIKRYPIMEWVDFFEYVENIKISIEFKSRNELENYRNNIKF